MYRKTLLSSATARLGDRAVPVRPVIDLASGQIAGVDLRDTPGMECFFLTDARFYELLRHAHHALPERIGLSLLAGGRCLDDPVFPLVLAQALKRQGLAPERLTLYFQDRHCLDRGMAALDRLLALKRLGFQLGLDIKDLNAMPALLVERLPVDILRLDPLDIMDVTVNRETAALAAEFVTFAGNLLMRPAARGVRHENQLAVLKRLGFSLAQGPYFAMPSLPDAPPSPSPSEREEASGRDRPS